MAQIDASIYNAFAPKVRSIQDYDNERMQGQMNALSLTQNRQKVDEYQRKVEQENALRTFQRGLAGKTRPEQAQAYLDAGYVDQANALTDAEGKFQTAQANVRQSDAAALSSTATAGKVGLEAKIKASDFHVQQLGSVNDPQSALAWAEAGLKSGIFTPEQYQAGLQRIQQAAASPQAFSQWRQMALQGGMSATEQLKQKLEQQKAMETQRHNRSTEGIQGGQLAVSQARLNMDRQNATGAVTYQQDANGNMVALPTRPGAGAIPAQQVIGADGRPIRGRTSGYSMPTAALKLQQEDLEAIGSAAGINADLSALQDQLTSGKLSLGPISNLANSARNLTGNSNEQSRNLSSFKGTIEKIRNQTLMLNKGVQTEGDAQRVLNEMFANINDGENVKQRLQELRVINERAIELRKSNVNVLRSNFGQSEMDFGAYEKQKPALGGAKPATSGAQGNSKDAMALEWARSNPGDPRAKAIMERLGAF